MLLRKSLDRQYDSLGIPSQERPIQKVLIFPIVGVFGLQGLVLGRQCSQVSFDSMFAHGVLIALVREQVPRMPLADGFEWGNITLEI